MKNQPLIPPQSDQVPPCPVCQRPIYPDLEHNPLCAAIANLQSLVYKAAGTLEEDQAERWAELHTRMTGLHGEMPEEVRKELDTLSERIRALEAKQPTPHPSPETGAAEEKKEESAQVKPGESAIVTP